MPFIWSTDPNPPAREMPEPVPPGQVTYQVHVIANSVDPKCTVTYNTPNAGYDELCQLASANVNRAFFTDAVFDNLTINTANIGVATINVANIQSANLLNANILYGYVGSDPTSNLGIATKHYVDAAIANVPVGGSDLQNIIDAKGDLLVGIGFHTATRLPVGNDGQVLISDSTSPVGMKWANFTSSEEFSDIVVGTHYNIDSNDHVVLLRSAREIIMNDGVRTTNWVNKTADIEVSGAGGLDEGVEETNQWYEVYAIRNSTSGNTSLLLHRMPKIELDQSLVTTSDTAVTVRKASGGTATKVAQSFIPAVAGPLTSVEIEVTKTGSPTGLIWVTLEADSGGFPSNSPLATSRVMDVSRLPTDKARVRFLFDTNTSVSLGTTYHLVYQGDYTVSDTNYTTMWGLAANGYASGYASEYRGSSWVTSLSLLGASDMWFKTFVQSKSATPVVMPSGYNQRSLVSYVCNDANGKFKQYQQVNRRVFTGTGSSWRAFTSVTGLIEAVDLSLVLPPVVEVIASFTHLATLGTPQIHMSIGYWDTTDIPTTDPIGVGVLGLNMANSRSSTIGTSYISMTPHAPMAIVEPVILTRMQNTNCRLYMTSYLF